MSSPPLGLRWRASTFFIVATVAVGIFTDLFLYGLIVPVLPFLLRDRISLPQDRVQSYSSGLLAAYAGASVLFSLPAGWIADRTASRRLPFLSGIAALLAATLMLSLGQTMGLLVSARILQGMSGAVVWTVGLAMIMDTVGVENLGKVMGTIFSVVSVGELAAPVLGGILYDKTGFVGVFGLSAGILTIDFAMRLFVVEKKVAARFEDPKHDASNGCIDQADNVPDDRSPASEEAPLLQKAEADYYTIPPNQNKLIKALPIIYCLSSPRLLTALLLAFMQALIVGTFDATVPTEAQSLFDFSSLTSGLLFIALDIPYLVFGPLAGWAVDRYGPKPASVFGFGYLAPVLILLRLPHAGGKDQIIFLCGLLALCGVGMGVIGSPSIVEASNVVQKFDKANGEVFGDNGPYAQLYGLNSLVFSAGLTVGPILWGSLRDSIGYGNMYLVVACLSGITALLSFVFVGGKPRMLSLKDR
jgi:MFS family permease